MKISLKKLLSKILSAIQDIQTTLSTLTLYKTGTGTTTVTTGAWSTAPTYVRRGYVVMVSGTVKATKSIASGSNVAEGYIKNIPKPLKHCRTVDYYGDNTNVTYLTTDGHYITRNCGNDALASGNTAFVTWTYITDGTML